MDTTTRRSLRAATRAFVLATAGMLVLTAGSVSAKPMASVTIEETSTCNFTVTFDWAGMGHGNDLTVGVSLFALDGSGGWLIDWAQTSPVSGSGGQFSQTFVSTESAPARYEGYAYLQSRGKIIGRSEVYSSITPSTPESCAP